MGMVRDYAMLRCKAIYAFNQYAINRFRLYYQRFPQGRPAPLIGK